MYRVLSGRKYLAIFMFRLDGLLRAFAFLPLEELDLITFETDFFEALPRVGVGFEVTGAGSISVVVGEASTGCCDGLDCKRKGNDSIGLFIADCSNCSLRLLRYGVLLAGPAGVPSDGVKVMVEAFSFVALNTNFLVLDEESSWKVTLRLEVEVEGIT